MNHPQEAQSQIQYHLFLKHLQMGWSPQLLGELLVQPELAEIGKPRYLDSAIWSIVGLLSL